MWKYVRKYLFFAVLAALFMMGEVMMDLVQPSLMMDKGRIVETGNHDELISQKGKYYELYMTQYAEIET